MKKTATYFLLIGFLILTSVLCWITAKRWTLPYENGRYFDETTMTVVKEQSILVYFLLTVIAVILTIILAISVKKERKKTSKINSQ